MEFFFILTWITSAIICGIIASIKGRNELWGLIGLIFGVFAVAVILAVEPKVGKGVYKICPYCDEIVRSKAKICKHCRSDLSNNENITT